VGKVRDDEVVAEGGVPFSQGGRVGADVFVDLCVGLGGEGGVGGREGR
jgi:hypothetical protein